MIDIRRKSPLAHRETLGARDASVRLCERAFDDKLILRVSPEIEAAKALGFLPPPNRSAEMEGGAALWLGPDEWMVFSPPGEGGALAARLGKALGKTHHQITDVSDYYTRIGISGSKAGETLMKLTPLDLHPRAFKTGDVAGTVFGKAAGWILNRSGKVAVFDIFIRWSMADYLWCLIAEAGREFGLPAQTPAGQVRGLRHKA